MDFVKGLGGVHKGIEGAGLVRPPLGQVLDHSPGIPAEHGFHAPLSGRMEPKYDKESVTYISTSVHMRS
jgi:hypothetical protein